jgi:hypothetical protein
MLELMFGPFIYGLIAGPILVSWAMAVIFWM